MAASMKTDRPLPRIDVQLFIGGKWIEAEKGERMGQICISVNRVYVEERIAEKFAVRPATHVAGLKVGYGLDPRERKRQTDHPETILKTPAGKKAASGAS